MKKAGTFLLIIFSFLCVTPGMSQELKPENWSPTWINPSWDRPENMIPDGSISLPGDINLAQIFEPTTCKGCHSTIYDQWNGGVHSLALQDPIFQAASSLFLTEAQASGDAGAIEEALSCVRCHSPIGHLSKTVETTASGFDNFSSDDARDSIFCDFCHSVQSSAGIGNAPFMVEAGQGSSSPGIKWGPRNDSPETGFHATAYSELHTRSEMCGMCHDVTHTLNGTPLERTYTEWREGPYNTGDPQTTVYCQDCHMRQKPGVPATGSTELKPLNPGQSSPLGPERPHIFTHYVVGGNTVIPSNETTQKMAEERLQNCAEIEIVPPERALPFIKTSFQVIVKNTGAGHYLPTGLSEVREVWLHVKVSSSLSGTFFESGQVSANGDVDAEARMFKIMLADKEGNHTANVALADHIKSDTRIPPQGSAVETYAMAVPMRALTGFTITATLKYRSASQSLVNALLGNAAPVLPIIEMASATTTVGR